MRVTGTAFAVCVLVGTAAMEARAAGEWHGAGQAGPAMQTGARAAAATRHATPRARAARAVPGGISCVPYARGVTGMAIYGNGGDWWGNAAGSYDRGQRPEPGSIMAFRATGWMTRGHVAVVSRVLGAREVLIDHANWGGPGIRKGTVMHNISVIDVSDNNDWSAVRVQVGYDPNTFGRVYPVFGFIYNRPDGDAGTAYAAAPVRRSAPLEQMAELPLDARPVAFQLQGGAPLRAAAGRPR